MKQYAFIITLISLFLTACQPADTLPTLAASPVLTNTPQATSLPTITPRVVASPTPLATDFYSPTPLVSPTPTDTPTATAWVLVPPTITATPLPEQFLFGKSAGGRDLQAWRFGTGGEIVLLVGGIHAGYEANTIRLMQELIAHFRATPQDIPHNVSVLIVPVLNVDGSAFNGLAGRFNANGVDLNRNWGCGWQEEAFFRDGTVNAGTHSFSEPETQALGALIQLTLPRAVLFYHSAARGVFAGNCGGSLSQALAQRYGEASGYPYGEAFSAYPVTGTAPNWVDSLGIPSVDIELATAEDTERIGNLRAIQAILTWVSQGR